MTAPTVAAATEGFSEVVRGLIEAGRSGDPDALAAAILAHSAALDALIHAARAENPDTQRLDWLDAQRRTYSRPPMRAVTGWQWSVVSERGSDGVEASTSIRETLDAARAPERGPEEPTR